MVNIMYPHHSLAHTIFAGWLPGEDEECVVVSLMQVDQPRVLDVGAELVGAQ